MVCFSALETSCLIACRNFETEHRIGYRNIEYKYPRIRRWKFVQSWKCSKCKHSEKELCSSSCLSCVVTVSHSTAIGMSFPGLKLSDCEVDHYHLILRLKWVALYLQFPMHVPPWCTQRFHLYIYIYIYIYSFIQYSVWRQVQSLLQNDAST